MNTFPAEYPQVHSFIKNLMLKAFAEPAGCFKYPTPTTTSGDFYQALFTWDTHHMTLRHAMDGHPEIMKHFLLTMFDFQRPNGYISSVISADGGPLFSDFHAQPYLAQNAAIYFSLTCDRELIAEIYPKLEKYLAYYDNNLSAPGSLYRWKEPWMSGFDNEVASSFFPQDTILLPDIQSLLYLEFRAMAYLAQALERQENYSAKAEQLKEAVNHYFWDEKTGVYAAYNLLSASTLAGMVYEGIPEHIGKHAFVSCPTLMPLFAGIAPPERAERLIENVVLSPEHFRSPWGIRSLSRSSEYYNNARWGNPPRFGDWHKLTNSNWQGPVWIPLNWFAFHGLLRYGYTDAAADLADDTVRLIANSLDKLGFMRENFHAETGEPLYADCFASWNILSDSFHWYLSDAPEKLELFPWEKCSCDI